MYTTPIYVVEKGSYCLSTDRELLDVDLIHRYLTRSYWSPGIPRHLVCTMVENSLCFGLYDDGVQIGFSRVVTDMATFAYLADVFVLPSHRRRGVGTWMVREVVACPHLDGIRSFFLATLDAHELYEKFGFEQIQNSERLMAIRYSMEWRNDDLANTFPGERSD